MRRRAPGDVVLLDRLELPGVRVPLPMRLPRRCGRPPTICGPARAQPAGASFLIVTHAACGRRSAR
ncbi:MAG: hypothetical protein U0Z44_05910 [Kouleothrix sp.]